jgi:hypothetical protein
MALSSSYFTLTSPGPGGAKSTSRNSGGTPTFLKTIARTIPTFPIEINGQEDFALANILRPFSFLRLS